MSVVQHHPQQVDLGVPVHPPAGMSSRSPPGPPGPGRTPCATPAAGSSRTGQQAFPGAAVEPGRVEFGSVTVVDLSPPPPSFPPTPCKCPRCPPGNRPAPCRICRLRKLNAIVAAHAGDDRCGPRAKKPKTLTDLCCLLAGFVGSGPSTPLPPTSAEVMAWFKGRCSVRNQSARTRQEWKVPVAVGSVKVNSISPG